MWESIVWHMKAGFYSMCGVFALASFITLRKVKQEPAKTLGLAGMLWRMIFKR